MFPWANQRLTVRITVLAVLALTPSPALSQPRAQVSRPRVREGRVIISGGVPGAEVLIDGVTVATLPLREPIRMPAGRVEIEVRAPGFSTERRTISVRAGALARERIELARQESRPVDRACPPGAQMACACPGGTAGTQICNPEGSAFLPCSCPTESRAEGTQTLVLVPGTQPQQRRRWYGWQPLIIDLVGQTVLIVGVSTDSVGAFWTGAGMMLFGAPITHWVHGRVGAGFGSLGIRLGSVIGGAAVGAAVTKSDGDRAGLTAGGVVLGLGFLVATIIDSAALSYQRVETPTRASRGTWTLGFSPTPGQGFTVGAAGTF